MKSTRQGKTRRSRISVFNRNSLALRIRRGKLAIARHGDGRGLGQAVGKFHGADTRHAFGAWQVVETAVFCFGAPVPCALPRGLRLAAGDRFSQRRGLQSSRRRRPHLACCDDAGAGRPAGHAFQRRQGERHELRRDHGLGPAEPQAGRDRMGGDPARRSECRLRRARRKISRWRQGVHSGAERATCAPAAGHRKVFLFIHGFNTMFAEGVYRAAQLAHDSKAPGVPVLFTWASRGKPTAYVYDLNSATAARDGLEHTLRLLLRQQRRRGQRARAFDGQLGHGRGVPADQDFGRPQLPEQDRQRRFSRLPISTSMCSNRRCAASASRRSPSISSSPGTIGRFSVQYNRGWRTRVGDKTDVAELAALGATVIDLTDLKATDATNHDKFVQLASVGPELRGILAHGIEPIIERVTRAKER